MQCINNPLKIPLPHPNTFAGLMELYENNYIKLKKLCGDFNVLNEVSVSTINHGMDLYLQVIERTKYTVTINLTYRFDKKLYQDESKYPNLVIRIYFDAMQAEVMQRVVRKGPRNHTLGCHLKSKWRDNRFLFKWLSFCLHQGHEFSSN